MLYITKDKEVVLKTIKGVYTGYILDAQTGRCCFCCESHEYNRQPFSDLNLSPEVVFLKLLGYCHSGDWPWCNTVEDVIKVLEFLSNYNKDCIFIDLKLALTKI